MLFQIYLFNLVIFEIHEIYAAARYIAKYLFDNKIRHSVVVFRKVCDGILEDIHFVEFVAR